MKPRLATISKSEMITHLTFHSPEAKTEASPPLLDGSSVPAVAFYWGLGRRFLGLGGKPEKLAMIELDTFDYTTIDEKIREDVRRLGNTFRKLERSSTKLAIDAGFVLCELKERLPHGQFLLYCDEALNTKERKAQLQMRLARFSDKIARDRLELLPVTVAYKLAAPEVPEPLIFEIVADFEGGKVLTVKIVLTRIKEGKKSSSRRPDVTEAQIDKVHAMLTAALEEAEIAHLVGFLTKARPKAIRELTGRLGSSIAIPERPRTMSLPAVLG